MKTIIFLPIIYLVTTFLSFAQNTDNQAKYIADLERRLSKLEAKEASHSSNSVSQNSPAKPKAPVAKTAPLPADPPIKQGAADELLKKNGEKLSLDRPITAIPAFTALDLTPESVESPSNPREFAAALLNGVDKQGTLQTGIAMETTPLRWLPGVKLDFPNYNSDDASGYWTRFLYNFSFSLATSKASGNEDEKAVNLALGFQTVLWQDSENDPLRNEALQESFHSAFDPLVGNIPAFGDMADSSTIDEAQAAYQKSVAKFRERQWIGTLWTAAIAPTWHSASGQADDLEAEGFTAWSTFAYAFEKPLTEGNVRAQLIGQLRYRQKETLIDPSDATHEVQQDSLLAALRLRVGTPDFNGFLEAGYQQIWNGFDGDDNAVRAAIGLEHRLSKDLWLVLSAGEQFGGGDSDELFAVGSFRFGSAEKPSF